VARGQWTRPLSAASICITLSQHPPESDFLLLLGILIAHHRRVHTGDARVVLEVLLVVFLRAEDEQRRTGSKQRMSVEDGGAESTLQTQHSTGYHPTHVALWRGLYGDNLRCAVVQRPECEPADVRAQVKHCLAVVREVIALARLAVLRAVVDAVDRLLAALCTPVALEIAARLLDNAALSTSPLRRLKRVRRKQTIDDPCSQNAQQTAGGANR
jgi:hypothetical protein